jgi:hypothetical protein
MQINRRKKKTIDDREKEIIKDFFRSFYVPKKPSTSGWFFGLREEKNDIKNKLKSTRARLTELYGEKTKTSSVGSLGIKSPVMPKPHQYDENPRVNKKHFKFMGGGFSEKKKAPAENTVEGKIILINKKEETKDSKKEDLILAAANSEKPQPGIREENEIAPLREDDPKLISISEIAKTSKYKREYIGFLVRQKKLKAQKVNGNWMVTKEWLDEFTKDAEERKEGNKAKLSEKLSSENLKSKLFVLPRLDFGNGWKPAMAVIFLVAILATVNFAKADYLTWRDKAAENILMAYNFTLEKVSASFPGMDQGFAKTIHALKVGTDKIDSFANSITGRKKVDQYEKATSLSVRGPQEGKEDLVRSEEETMGGIVAGDESSMISDRKGIVLAETTGTLLANVGDIEIDAYVLDENNREVANGEYSVRFSLYTLDRAETDAYPSDTDQSSRVWEESQTVKIQNGLLTTYLGQVSPIPTGFNFGSGKYYLGIRIGENAELIPRKRIGAVPLARTAMNALTAQSISGYAVGNASGNISISNGTINTNLNADLLDGQHASAFQAAGNYQAAGTYDNYVSWKLQSSATDAGQQIKTKKGAVFAGANGILTSRNLNTLTISLDPNASPTFAGMTLNGNLSMGTNAINATNYTIASDGTITGATWNGNTIDISSYTNLATSGALLQMTGDTLSVREGILSSSKICTYEAGIGLVCDTDAGAVGVSYWSANGNDIYNNNLGNVGIGTTATWAKLSVYLDATGDYSSAGNFSINGVSDGSPWSSYYGLQADASVSASSSLDIFQAVGMDAQAYNYGSGNIGNLVGTYSMAVSSGEGNVSDCKERPFK